MSKADIQYMPLTKDRERCNPDPVAELLQANIWLAEGLDGERRSRREAEHVMMALAVMLAVTVTLLVLTWAGYITI